MAPTGQELEIQGRALQLAQKMPTGMVATTEDLQFWTAVFEVLCLPGVVLRRKLRVVPEQFDGQRVEVQLLDWLLAQVGLDRTQPVVQLLSNTAKRTLARQAPALFRTRGTREGLRAAARRGGPFPPFVADWFNLRTVLDVDALPLIMVSDPLAGAYETEIHIAEGSIATPTDRDLIEELIRMQLGICEVANVRYIIAFDNGANGTGQWDPVGVFDAPDAPPYYLRASYLAAQAWNVAMAQTSRNYAAWFAVTPVESTSTPRMWVYGNPSAGTGYSLKLTPVSGAGCTWELRGAGLLASGTYPTFEAGVTYLIQFALYNEGDGVHIAVAMDGDPLCDVTDATNHRTGGPVGFDTQNADCDLEFVHVHGPGLTDSAVVEHSGVIK